jgi:ferredoxin hydrogenase
MQGATVKTYFAKKMGIAPQKIVLVCLTPCTAKKMEIRRPELCDAGKAQNVEGMRDVDYVITVREFAKWAKDEGIKFDKAPTGNFDKYMGQSSGAGVIFGNTGGVMEAAIRTAYERITGKKPPERLYELQEVRGYKDVRAASITIQGKRLNVAVIYGTANADKFIEHLKTSEVKYQFIEVMSCPGGCVGGGGEPKHIGKNIDEFNEARIAGLYERDRSLDVRASQYNQEILDLYTDFYGLPCSEKAEQLLHTTYEAKPTNLLPRSEWQHLNKGNFGQTAAQAEQSVPADEPEEDTQADEETITEQEDLEGLEEQAEEEITENPKSKKAKSKQKTKDKKAKKGGKKKE